MASFVEDLWNSIFTPGPTPTLLIATNVAFAALQILLGGLFIATFSVHFAVLSVLCGGLWIAINWFAKEIRELQAHEEEKKRRTVTLHDKDELGDAAGAALDSGDDTETDIAGASRSTRASRVNAQLNTPSNTTTTAAASSGANAQLAVPHAVDDVRKRRSLADSSGDLSTDSEWEKVEGK